MTQRAPTSRDALVDQLRVDGGWLSAAALAVASGAREDSIQRVLQRLRILGLVESRRVELAGVGRGRQPYRVETYLEWRYCGPFDDG